MNNNVKHSRRHFLVYGGVAAAGFVSHSIASVKLLPTTEASKQINLKCPIEMSEASCLSLQSISSDRFAPYIGQEFTVKMIDSVATLKLIKVDVQPYPSSVLQAHLPQGVRVEPFSLLFVSQSAMQMPSEIHHITHPELGSLNLFISPVNGAQNKHNKRDGTGQRYNVVFA